MRKFTQTVFLLVLVGLISSCKTGRWNNFNAQKHTKLSQIKAKDTEQERSELQDADDNINYQTSPVETDGAGQYADIQSSQKETATDEAKDIDLSPANYRTTKSDKEKSEEVETESYNNENSKVNKKLDWKPHPKWNWLFYTLLIIAGAIMFVGGWFIISFEGGAFGVILFIAGALLMLTVVIHALVKLYKSGGDKQRRGLFLYSTFLVLVIMTFLITFYWTA